VADELRRPTFPTACPTLHLHVRASEVQTGVTQTGDFEWKTVGDIRNSVLVSGNVFPTGADGFRRSPTVPDGPTHTHLNTGKMTMSSEAPSHPPPSPFLRQQPLQNTSSSGTTYQNTFPTSTSTATSTYWREKLRDIGEKTEQKSEKTQKETTQIQNKSCESDLRRSQRAHASTQAWDAAKKKEIVSTAEKINYVQICAKSENSEKEKKR